MIYGLATAFGIQQITDQACVATNLSVNLSRIRWLKLGTGWTIWRQTPGPSLGCGEAMLQILASERPAPAADSYVPDIEP